MLTHLQRLFPESAALSYVVWLHATDDRLFMQLRSEGKQLQLSKVG